MAHAAQRRSEAASIQRAFHPCRWQTAAFQRSPAQRPGAKGKPHRPPLTGSSPGDSIAEAFEQAQTFRRGRFENDLQLDHGLDFYTEVASKGDRSGLSRTFRLSHEGRTVAILFGLIDRSTFATSSSPATMTAIRSFRLVCSFSSESSRIGRNPVRCIRLHHRRRNPTSAELGCTSTPMFAFGISAGDDC